MSRRQCAALLIISINTAHQQTENLQAVPVAKSKAQTSGDEGGGRLGGAEKEGKKDK